jgi:RNA polymerase sigma-70 factor, ECF subfamily
VATDQGGHEKAGEVEAAVADAFREHWGRVVATLIGLTRNWDLAEECAQEAFALALTAWRRDGIPRQPGAWLITAARNRAIDRIRRDQVGAAKLRQIGALLPADEGVDVSAEDGDDVLDSGIRDDRLRLIYTCCHPALAFEAQVALALRTLCGLSTTEIARAFQISEPAVAKRLVRTRHKIAVAGIPYRVPPAHLLPERTNAVLGVVYLLFNEGYAATSGPSLVRTDLCDQAVWLAGMVAELMPDHPEAGGLHALLLLLHARTAARIDASGTLVPLEEQDRSRWDRPMIEAGLAAVAHALRRETIGPYQLQALIAACHATAARAEDTDWYQIVDLYDQLVVLVPSWTVRLNRAVAVAMRSGAQAGLDLLDTLDGGGDPPPSHLLPAVRADLLRRLGADAEARKHYRLALAGTDNAGERAYLARRLAEVEDRGRPGPPRSS